MAYNNYGEKISDTPKKTTTTVSSGLGSGGGGSGGGSNNNSLTKQLADLKTAYERAKAGGADQSALAGYKASGDALRSLGANETDANVYTYGNPKGYYDGWSISGGNGGGVGQYQNNPIQALAQAMMQAQQKPTENLSRFNTKIPKTDPGIGYSKATQMATAQYRPLYQQQMIQSLQNVDKDTINRGFFGQLPAAVLRRSTAAQVQAAENSAVGQLANQLVNQSEENAARQQQMALQQWQAENSLRQQAYDNAANEQKNNIANLLSIYASQQNDSKLTEEQRQANINAAAKLSEMFGVGVQPKSSGQELFNQVLGMPTQESRYQQAALDNQRYNADLDYSASMYNTDRDYEASMNKSTATKETPTRYYDAAVASSDYYRSGDDYYDDVVSNRTSLIQKIGASNYDKLLERAEETRGENWEGQNNWRPGAKSPISELLNPNTPTSGKVSTNVDSWIKEAMKISGVGNDWYNSLAWLVQHESGGNPGIKNKTPVGKEHATGLMQTLPSTFRAHAKSGMTDINNPVHNLVAAISYIKGRYKHPDNAVSGWAKRGGY